MHTWSKLNYCVYKVSGDDAVTFLQGQLTQDINTITPTQAQLAAYCNAKGRMFALLLLFKDADNNLYLRINKSIEETVIKRLKMFVLRSKVNFEITDLVAYGLDAATAANTLSGINENVDNLVCKMANQTFVIKMPGLSRFECYVPQSDCEAFTATLNRLAAENSSGYLALDIQSGFYNIEPSTLETALPQTTPLESWNGISYSKGCYVGQEIIARSKYKGSVKRQLMVAQSSNKVLVGDSIYDNDNVIANVLMSNYDENSSPPYFISAIISLGYENKPLLINEETHQFAGTDGGKS